LFGGLTAERNSWNPHASAVVMRPLLTVTDKGQTDGRTATTLTANRAAGKICSPVVHMHDTALSLSKYLDYSIEGNDKFDNVDVMLIPGVR